MSTGREGGLLEARQDYARRHPLRLHIIALSVRKGQSLDPEDLRRELPDHPAVALIEYHVRVLREVGLLSPDPSPAKPTKAQVDEWIDRR